MLTTTKTDFEYSDVEVAWNGDMQEPWIDIDLHDDNLPEFETTVVSRIQLTPAQALAFATAILAQHNRFTDIAAVDLAAPSTRQ